MSGVRARSPVTPNGTCACHVEPQEDHEVKRWYRVAIPAVCVVVVEEKATAHLLTDEEFARVITYLCATGAPVGLLLNFGRNLLQYRRVFPPKNIERWRDRVRRYIWTPREHGRSVNPLPHPLTANHGPRVRTAASNATHWAWGLMIDPRPQRR